MKQKIFLVRHAHRDTSQGRERDNSLSEKGLRQANGLCSELFEILAEKNTALISSPAKRCVETLLPLSRKLRARLKLSPLLGEQEPEENEGDLIKRIGAFWQVFKHPKKNCLVICTHGDWIEEFLSEAARSKLSLQKGEFAVLERSAGDNFKLRQRPRKR